jgi:Fe-S-cluster containining protein
MLRNLGWLKSEGWWAALSARARRVMAIRMLGQRAAVFREVRIWRQAPRPAQPPVPQTGENPGVPEYCNKCGLCCEVASGMPDFPAPETVPAGWRDLFGNGLGKGHRFCPFLWEDNASNGGLCSIYGLRSNPCRLFGVEECEFFWKSSEPRELSNAPKILQLGRWLIKQRKLRPVRPRPRDPDSVK